MNLKLMKANSTPLKKPSATTSFNELFAAPEGERNLDGLKLIDYAQIEVTAQARTIFPTNEIEELARSIDSLRSRGEGIEGTGILQPLLVIPSADRVEDGATSSRYRLVAGERRFRAAQSLELKHVPAFVLPVRGENVLLTQILENLQRRDLPPLDEARAFEQLAATQKLSVRDIARLLGKDKGYVENRLRLLKMQEDLQNMVSVRTDSLQHARFIDPVENKSLRKSLITAVTADGISVREVERRIEAATQPKANSKRDTEQVSVRTDTGGATGKENSQQIVRLSEQTLTDARSALALLRDITRTAEFTARWLSDNRTSTSGKSTQLKRQILKLETQIARIKESF